MSCEATGPSDAQTILFGNIVEDHLCESASGVKIIIIIIIKLFMGML